MGHPDGAHTHGSGGGSGIGTAVLVILGATLAVNLAGPVAAAAGELLHIVMIAAGVILGVGAAGLVALGAWRLRQSRASSITPVSSPRAVPPGAAASIEGPQRSALERPAVHLHLHGVTAEEIAAALRYAQEQASGPDDDQSCPT